MRQRQFERSKLQLLLLAVCWVALSPIDAQDPSQVFRFNFKRAVRVDEYFSRVFTSHADRGRLVSLIDFKRPGLYLAKRLCVDRQWDRGLSETFSYFQNQIVKWDLPEPDLIPFNSSLACADEAVKNIFTLHGSGARPIRVDFGQSIAWSTGGNPLWASSKDMQWMWSLHRVPYWMSLAHAYKRTRREVYFQAFKAQFEDWLRHNPRDPRYDYDVGARFKLTPDHPWTTERSLWPNPEHPELSWAWRREDVAHRLMLLPYLLQAFVSSTGFTLTLMVQMLNSLHEHAQFLANNPYFPMPYRADERGGLEAAAVAFAGTILPEYFDSVTWRSKAFAQLKQQLRTFVAPDGMVITGVPSQQYRFLRMFFDVPRLAQVSDISHFPPWYWGKVQQIASALVSVALPDGTIPMFHDSAKIQTGFASTMRTLGLFFGRKDFMYFGGESEFRSFTSDSTDAAFYFAGLYSMRSDWSEEAVLLVARCGPSPNDAHRDAGGFELFYNGLSLTPESGSYRRDDAIQDQGWGYFHSSTAHNVLTLDDDDAHEPSAASGPFSHRGGYNDCGLLHWEPHEERDDKHSILVTESFRTYQDPDLSHRRSIVFVDRKFFVIVDEASGEAKGDVAVHFQLRNCSYDILAGQGVATVCSDNGNVLIQSLGNFEETQAAEIDVGWLAVAEGVKIPRPRVNFRRNKDTNNVVRFYTAVVPFSDGKSPTVSGSVVAREENEHAEVELEVVVNDETFHVSYSYNPVDFKMPSPAKAYVRPDWVPSAADKEFIENFEKFISAEETEEEPVELAELDAEDSESVEV